MADNSRIQDSLDNLSNTKLRQSSLQKQKIQLIHIKQQFVSLLQKLQSSQTRQISLTQMKKLIQHNVQPDHLRIYLSIMRTLKPNHNSTTKEHQILVISIILQCFKHNLIDPVDKQLSLPKTAFKIVQILLGFFNDISGTVQQACARVLLDLNYFCLQQGKFDKQQKLSILFTPLVSILKNGVDKASQSTASVCINQLIRYWYKNSQNQYLQLICKDMFLILLKINSQYQDIFMATLIMIEYKGLGFFQNKLSNFIVKVLPVINGTRQGSNNINSYMCKVNVCKIIEKIAILLTAEERTKLMDLNVIEALQKAARNKIIQVQMAANRALKAWSGNPMPEEKNQKRSSSQGKTIKSLQQIRDQKKRQRSSSKQHTIKMENQLNYMKEDLQKMVKGGWGANNRAKNYAKRGTGTGGGYYGQVQYTTPPKVNKSHRQHLEQLRQIIKKGSRENKNIDRYDLIKQKGNNQTRINPHIPTSSNTNNYNNNNLKSINNNQFMNKNLQQKQEKLDPNSQRMNSNKNIPTNNFINNKKNSLKVLDNYEQKDNYDDNDDGFQVEQQTGDQAINYHNFPGYQIKKSTKKQQIPQNKYNKVEDVVIRTQQAEQLLQHERSLMSHLDKNNNVVDMFSQSMKKRKYSQPIKSQRVLQKPPSSKNINNINRQDINSYKNQLENMKQVKNLNSYSNNNINNQYKQQQLYKMNNIQQNHIKPQQDHKKSARASRLKQNLTKFSQMISQQQLNELIMDNNLSQVSQNLSNILNESDFNLVNNQSINQQSYYEQSIKMKQKSKFANSIRKQQQSMSAKNNSKKFQVSLNYTQSGVSNSNKPTKYQQQQQFTLNPHQNVNNINKNIQQNAKKFQSIFEYDDNKNQEEIQQDIYQSCFQQSKPKQSYKVTPRDQNNWKKIGVPKVVNDISISPKKDKNNRQQQQSHQVSKNYQQLIQNPPALNKTHLDKKSNLHPSRITQHNNSNSNNSFNRSNTQQQQQQYSQSPPPTVTSQWLRILSLIQSNQLNLAFQLAFQLDDPIYLIRLLIITKTPLSQLTLQNCSQLWSRFLQIYKHNFISILTVQMFTQANQLNLVKNSLNIEEMHELMVKLYEISGTSTGKLSFNAAVLYNNIDQSIKKRKQ